MDTFDILINGLKKIPGMDNGWDRVIAPFEGSLEYDQKRFLGIPNNERVAYIRIIDADRTVPCSLAITDKGIYYRMINKFFFATVQDKKFSIKFSEVNEVRYSEADDSYIFSDGSSLGRHELVKKLDSSYRTLFAQILEYAAKSVEGMFDYYERGLELLEKDQYDKALSEFSMAMQMAQEDKEFLKSDERAYLYFYIGRCQMLLERENDSKSNLITAQEIASKSSDAELKNELLPAILANLAHVVSSRIESHKLLAEAYEKASDSETKRMLLESLNDLHDSESFKKEFTSKESISQRKAILVLKDNSMPFSSLSFVGLERSLANNIHLSFPIGHPVEGVLYVVHPTRLDYYIPKAVYEETIFLEKVNEYCYLLQCLGAKEIKIHKLQGRTIEEMNLSKMNAEASLSGWKVGVSGNASFQDCQRTNNSESYKFSSRMTFATKGKPFVPSDLNWLAVEPRWKRLIDNRLNGELNHYEEEISTSEDKMFSSSEEMRLNSEINVLISKVKGSLNIEELSSSNSCQNTTWRIEVDF